MAGLAALIRALHPSKPLAPFLTALLAIGLAAGTGTAFGQASPLQGPGLVPAPPSKAVRPAPSEGMLPGPSPTGHAPTADPAEKGKDQSIPKPESITPVPPPAPGEGRAIVQFEISGRFIEPPDVLERVLKSETGGRYIVPSQNEPEDPELGGDDPAGRHARLGTEGRLSLALRSLGYDSRIDARPTSGGVILKVELSPLPRVRQVYVHPYFRKFPLLEEEILPLVRFRPGQILPPADVIPAAIEEDRGRVVKYLERLGYFESTVGMYLAPRHGKEEGQVDVHITLSKGDPYSIPGDGPGLQFLRASTRDAVPLSDIRNLFHHPFRLQCLWLCGEFSMENLRNDQERLKQRFQSLGFYAVRVTDDFSPERSLEPVSNEARFVININTGKRAELKFRGNRHFSDDDLTAALTFAEAGSMDRYECEASARALERLYQLDGYYEASVEVFRQETPGDRVIELTFSIDEGKERKVRGLEFDGATAFSPDDLSAIIETRPFPTLGILGLGEGGYVTQKQLKQDEGRILDHYRKRGYLHATVVGEVAPIPAAIGLAGALGAAVVTASSSDDGDLFVRFRISEGPPVAITLVDIQFQTEEAKKDPYLQEHAWQQVRIRPGRPYSEEDVKNDRTSLERWLKQVGYRYAEVETVVVDEDEREAPVSTRKKVRFQVAEGERMSFGELMVRGNFKTQKRVISRELFYKPGDVYDESKVEQAERNLRSLDLFSTIRFQFRRPDGEPNRLHTYLEVEERHDDHGRIEAAFGYATDYKLYGQLGYSNRNVFGWGQGFESAVIYGQRRFDLRGTYIWPRWIGTRMRFELTGFWRTEDTIRLGKLRTKGLGATVSREIFPRARLFVRYELRQVQRPELLERVPGPLESLISVPVDTVVATLGPGIDIDRRDNILSPTRGYYASSSILFSTPMMDPCLFQPCQTATFIKINLTTKAYIPLGRGIHVAMGMRFDQGIPIGADLLPKTERFFAGGDTTVRGIEEDQLYTQLVTYPVPGLPGNPGIRRIPAGGNVRILQNLELIFPVRKSLTLPLMAAIFLDTGVVTPSLGSLSLRDFRHSIGIAPLRFGTPIGFGSVEYAWPLDPAIGDDPSGRFHFNFGFVF